MGVVVVDFYLRVFPAFSTDFVAGARNSYRDVMGNCALRFRQSTNERGFRDVSAQTGSEQAWENAMNNRSSRLLVTSIMVTMLSVGCNCITSNVRFTLEQRRVTITTEPPGASVTQINPLDESQTMLGTTPLNEIYVVILGNILCTRDISISESHRLLSHVGNVVVQIDKQEYESCRQVLRTDRKKTIEHNITLQSLTNP
jgi:hypothetical protein